MLLTVTKVKQEMINQDRTKIGPVFDFLLHLFKIEILIIVSQMSCEAVLKFASKNIEK